MDLPRIQRGRLITDGVVVPDGVVVWAGRTILWSGPTDGVPSPWRALLPAAGPATIIPGLVDIHCHGAAGGEFGADEAGMQAAALHHLRRGSTSVVASIASRTPAALLDAARSCSALAARGTVAGVHLEGPFLSYARRGAQNPDALSDLDPALLRRVGEAVDEGGGRLVQMTLAPERDPDDAGPAALARLGAVVALGHTDCDARAASAALALAAEHAPPGMRPIVTHLFNGMPPLHHRSPGPIAAALTAAARGEAVVELIADGVHVADDTVRMVFETVGSENVALVTDAMAACGMRDGSYTLGRLDVRVQGGVARLAEGDSIAGGTAVLLDVLARTVRAGVPIADAVRAATATPARALALGGDEPVGSLRTGSRADLLILDDDLRLSTVVRCGRLVQGLPGRAGRDSGRTEDPPR